MNCSAVCNGTDAHNPLIHSEPTGGTGQTAPRSGSANTVEDTSKMTRRHHATAASDGPFDVRVTMGFGTKPYGTLRVSAITASGDPTPPLTVDGQAVSWQYSDRFRYVRVLALHTQPLTLTLTLTLISLTRTHIIHWWSRRVQYKSHLSILCMHCSDHTRTLLKLSWCVRP